MQQNTQMPADIRVPIPSSGEDLRLYFDDMVENDGFGLALDFSVEEFGELARMTDIAVTGAEVTDLGVAVHYLVTWEAVRADDDSTVGGEHPRIVRGRADGTDWFFEKGATPTARKALDEL